MDILGDILGTTTSALSGGLFGLLGNVASKVLGYFQAKQDFVEKQAGWQHDLDLQKLQMQASAQQGAQQLQVAQSQGEWSGLAASVAAEGVVGASYPWVNAVRALIRPALTLGLTSFLCAAFFALTPGDIDRAYVADSLVFAAVTSIVWWFGDRAPRKNAR
jgi:Calicivirus putative RNA polymerase/capsid protein